MRISSRLSSILVAACVASTTVFAVGADFTVGFIPKLDTDPYFKATGEGAAEAQKEIGGKSLLVAPSTATGEAQIPFINNLVSKKVNVIAISAADSNSVAPALRRALSQKIHVLTFDSDCAKNAREVFVNQATQKSLAEMMLDSLGGMIGYEGEFAILSSMPTATNQNAWIESMKKRMADDPKFAKMKLVQVAYGQESAQINQQQALALAEAFPNLKGIIIPAGIGLPAAARALDQAGLLGKIKLTGLAPATLMKKYILAGQAQDIWWNVKDLGYLTYYAAEALATDKITGKKGDTFKAGRLGEYTVGDDGEVVLGPAVIVTPENVNSFAF